MRFDGLSFTAFTPDNTAGTTGYDISFNTLWEDDAGFSGLVRMGRK